MNNEFILKNGSGGLCCKGCGRQNNKLNTYDWLADIPGNGDEQEIVEVQFKNTRKGYFKNSNRLKLEKGDVVAVDRNSNLDRQTRSAPDAEIRNETGYGNQTYLPQGKTH